MIKNCITNHTKKLGSINPLKSQILTKQFENLRREYI